MHGHLLELGEALVGFGAEHLDCTVPHVVLTPTREVASEVIGFFVVVLDGQLRKVGVLDGEVTTATVNVLPVQ